ncbi:histidinol-phosphate aminotransferase 1 [Undibacterium sp. KW1]|uniref:histidinol-phosphate transaminase n=1 Tax=Undibacterium sp. KW1 TaxID=2058624 RepID=UPI001331FBC1|nr:histidinol-phosphate transaminase [Undibacterium sp. KW1]BBB63888.1 histidinol-phosphate aminotransferase 1 [Undibacterium sp. KW1]
MSKYWSDVVHKLSPYTPGEQPKIAKLIKLNTNENPYPPSPRVLTAIQQATNGDLRLYPDPGSDHLCKVIAQYHGLQADQIFVGNSSDEVLAHVFQALLKHQQPLLFPDISYSFYPVYCGLYEINHQSVPLDARFQLNVEDYLQENGGIIFANPNAPTGCAVPLEKIEFLLQHNRDTVVVIDEAYVDFGGETAIALIDRYPNLLVVHTLSKSRSLAGLRVGFAAGHADLIAGLNRVKNSFNAYPLDRLAVAGAIAAFEDQDYFLQTCQAVMATRERLAATMRDLGFEVLPSATNFIFASHPRFAAEEIALGLRQSGIIVRHFKLPRINEFLRISIGTDDESTALLAALKLLVKQG